MYPSLIIAQSSLKTDLMNRRRFHFQAGEFYSLKGNSPRLEHNVVSSDLENV